VLVSVSFHFFVIDILAKLVFFNLLELREAAQSKQTKLKLKCHSFLSFFVYFAVLAQA
jgi:hypothetical protein